MVTEQTTEASYNLDFYKTNLGQNFKLFAEMLLDTPMSMLLYYFKESMHSTFYVPGLILCSVST